VCAVVRMSKLRVKSFLTALFAPSWIVPIRIRLRDEA
jgi:hypothetical protein